MRNFSFLLLYLFVVSISVYSESIDTTSEIQNLLNKGLFHHADEIHELALNLNKIDKKSIFDEYSKETTGPVLMNLFPFPLGSFIQGDIVGASIGLTGDVLGISLSASGYYILLVQMFSVEKNSFDSINSAAMIISGGIIYLASGIFKITRPVIYAKKYNSELYSVLGVGSTSSMIIVPDIGLTSSGDVITSVNIKFSY